MNQEALAACAHCNWGQHRGDAGNVLEMVRAHLKTGHDVDVRFYNADVESPIEPTGEGKFDRIERTGDWK